MWWLSFSVLTGFLRILLRPLLATGNCLIFMFSSLSLETLAGRKLFCFKAFCAENEELRFPERSGPNGNYIWFDPIRAIQVTKNVPHLGWKRPAPTNTGQDQ